MLSNRLTAVVLAASVVAIPAPRVAADAGDFIAGAIIGGIVGSAATKNNQKKRTTTQRSRIPSTQEGRNIQASLNYFGFNAGTVDGQLGRQSRSAISNYQVYMGYPATGHLTPFEYDLLTTSYSRAQAGGYATQQVIATNPDGTRGLLKAYRAELAGQPLPTAPPVTNVVVQPQVIAPPPVAAQVVTPAPQAGTTTTTTTTVVAATAAESGGSDNALPNFFGNAGASASLASHCNTVSLLTSTNGYTTAATMTDPSQALNEQFCLARTYAIARSEELVSQVNGFTPAQVVKQCESFGPALIPYVSALSLKPRDAVVQDVSAFILSTGMSPAQLSGTAKICLGVGYRTDNMDVALGSALMLFSMGEAIYGELMGHHLALGFGTAKRIDMAPTWYEAALTAADNGAAAVFVPGQPDRNEIIRKASLQLGGAQQPSAAATLPVFSVTE